MSSNLDNDIPQWKKELILRRQSRSKSPSAVNVQQLQNTIPLPTGSVSFGSTVQQPSITCSGAVVAASVPKAVRVTCEPACYKTMVQERAWDHNQMKTLKIVSDNMSNEKGVDSDSSEELQYGPGIVSRLKNRYQSLAIRENAKARPSLVHMRKAASLEHILDDEEGEDHSYGDTKTGGTRLYEIKSNGTANNVTYRYKGTGRGFDMKRARSVEVISSGDDNSIVSTAVQPKRSTFDEEMLVIRKEGNENFCNDKKMSEINDNKIFSNNIGLRLNRPKRLQPVMNDREKPPADVVKEKKKIFERLEPRTKPPSGKVAEKIAYINTRNAKKPPTKQKPVVLDKSAVKPKPAVNEKEQPIKQVLKTKPPIKLPINDNRKAEKTASPTGDKNRKISSPDVDLSSPKPDVSNVIASSPTGQLNGFLNTSLCHTPDLILHSSHPQTISAAQKDSTEDFIKAEIHSSVIDKNQLNLFYNSETIGEGIESTGQKITPEAQKKLGNSVGFFDFSTTQISKSHLPSMAQSQNNKIPLTQPLKIEVGTANNVDYRSLCKKDSPQLMKHSPQLPHSPKPPKHSPQLPHSPKPPKHSPQLPHSPKLAKQDLKLSPQTPQVPVLHSPPKQRQNTQPVPIPHRPPHSVAPQRQPLSPPKQQPPKPPIKTPSSNTSNSQKVANSTSPGRTDNSEHAPIQKAVTPEAPIRAENTEHTSIQRVPSPKPANIENISAQQRVPPRTENNEKKLAQNITGHSVSQVVQPPKAPVRTESNENDSAQKKSNYNKPTSEPLLKLGVSVREKNLTNSVKTAERPPISKPVQSDTVQINQVPKSTRTARPKQEQNSTLFDFTKRKEVPDYVENRGSNRAGKIQRPKPGESGITILPGVTLDESIIDDDDVDSLLKRPPSPCNVTFVNDNVIINGRSSLMQKTKNPKMRIHFNDGDPDIYEYPSDASVLEELQAPPVASAPVGLTVPSLSGSSLANYTPKSSFTSEEFQLGLQPSTPTPTVNTTETKIQEEVSNGLDMHETEEPIVFSAGTNSDILF